MRSVIVQQRQWSAIRTYKCCCTWCSVHYQVDPIVASFCGGSVGVLSALLVVEVGATFDTLLLAGMQQEQ
jgi:hypothetical protein